MVRINENDVRWRVHFDKWQSWRLGVRDKRRLPNDENTADGEDRIAFFFRYVNERRVVKQLEVCDVSIGILYAQQDRCAGVVDCDAF